MGRPRTGFSFGWSKNRLQWRWNWRGVQYMFYPLGRPRCFKGYRDVGPGFFFRYPEHPLVSGLIVGMEKDVGNGIMDEDW